MVSAKEELLRTRPIHRMDVIEPFKCDDKKNNDVGKKMSTAIRYSEYSNIQKSVSLLDNAHPTKSIICM